MEDNLNIFFQEHLLAYVDGLTRALSRMEANVSIFTDNPTKFQGADVEYFPLRNKIISKIIPKTFIRIAEKISLYHWLVHTIGDLETDVLHVNVASGCEIFLKVKEKYRIPIIYTNHYVTEPEPLEDVCPTECATYENEKSLSLSYLKIHLKSSRYLILQKNVSKNYSESNQLQ